MNDKLAATIIGGDTTTQSHSRQTGDDDAAEKMYGATTPKNREAARREEGERAGAPRAGHAINESLAEGFYSAEKLYEYAFQSGEDTLRNEGWDEAKIEADRRQMSGLFVDLKLPAGKAGTLHGLLVHGRLNPADKETVQTWSRESRQKLRDKYGADADVRVKAVRAYIHTNKELAQLLSDSGLGSHPDVVMHFAERAHELSHVLEKRRRG